MKRVVDALAPAALILLLLAGWEAACRLTGVPAYFLPPPSKVMLAAASGLTVLVPAAWNTLSVALVALVLAAAAALALALLVGLSPLLERAVRPLASALQVTPVVAVAPLILIWAGIDHPERAVIALAVLVAFFPIFSGTVTGLRSADPDLERLFDLYGASRLQRVLRLPLCGKELLALLL
jgi:NitT/TauT family transport system permease protein